MSNDMKTIMESWKRAIKEEEPEEEEEESWWDSLKYTPDRKQRKEDFLAPLKQIAKDKASRHVAQTVAGERPSGTVFSGTDQGERDVRGMLELQKDIQNAMETLGADRPEDIPYELAKEFALQLAGVGVVAGGAKAYPHLEKWFKIYIKKFPFVLTKKGDPAPKWVKKFLSALTTTADDLPDAVRILKSKTYLSKDIFEETKK